MTEDDHSGHTFRQEEARMLSLLYQAQDVGNDWRDEALCTRLPIARVNDWFAPDGTPEAAQASDTCFECPVRKQCLEWASASKQKYGTWGGLPHSLRVQKITERRTIKPHDYDKLVELPNPYDTEDERSKFHRDNLSEWTDDDEENKDENEFEALTSSDEEGMNPFDDDEEELSTLWDVVEATWPMLYKDQGILVRGMMLVEIVGPDGLKDFRFLASPEMMPWDIQGFIKYASSELDIESLLDMLISSQLEHVEEDEDDEEE